jgi:hypothetical protein
MVGVGVGGRINHPSLHSLPNPLPHGSPPVKDHSKPEINMGIFKVLKGNSDEILFVRISLYPLAIKWIWLRRALFIYGIDSF